MEAPIRIQLEHERRLTATLLAEIVQWRTFMTGQQWSHEVADAMEETDAALSLAGITIQIAEEVDPNEDDQ